MMDSLHVAMKTIDHEISITTTSCRTFSPEVKWASFNLISKRVKLILKYWSANKCVFSMLECPAFDFCNPMVVYGPSSFELSEFNWIVLLDTWILLSIPTSNIRSHENLNEWSDLQHGSFEPRFRADIFSTGNPKCWFSMPVR